MRDVLGHTNALDRCFQPAESGLYQHLVCAQEEEKHRGADSRLYFVCLDEMNLAQVEHYFSGFIQALERPHAMREVRCFSPEMVAPSDPFAAWPTLNLPRTLRFVGTVNFDETTRQLSQRVLDRANLIRLHPSPLLDAKDPAPARAIGPVVTLRNYRDWIDPSPRLDRSLGELIDKLREPLHRLGCPLNPRRFNAIRKFVGSAPPEVAKPEQSLDLQIAQRVLPQVRNLFRPGARSASPSRCNRWRRWATATTRPSCSPRGRANDAGDDVQPDARRRAGRDAAARRRGGDRRRAAGGPRAG
jgi:hypothetical protein